MNHLSLTSASTNALLIAQIKVWQAQLSRLKTRDGAGQKQLIASLLRALETSLQQTTADHLIAWIQQAGLSLATHNTAPLSTQPPVQETLERIQTQRQLARSKNRYPGQSQLDIYQQEIRELIKQGASQRDIRWWLHREKRCKVSQPTICRYLKNQGIVP